MAKSRNKMPRSKCAHCQPCYYIEANGRLSPGFECILDEWDEFTSCTRGGCNYYRRRLADRLAQKNKKEAKHGK